MSEIICPITFWKPVVIEGVRDFYEVSDDGRVRNKNSGKVLKPDTINSGYQNIRLFTGDSSFYKTGNYSGRYKHVLVHRLVMDTFCPIKDSDKMVVNHIDTDRTNNDIRNLEWTTPSENAQHAADYYKDNKPRDYGINFTEDQFKIIIKESLKGTSNKEILNKIGIENTPINRGYISDIKRGKLFQASASAALADIMDNSED